MTNDELNPNDETQKGSVIVALEIGIRASTFLCHSTFELRHSFLFVAQRFEKAESGSFARGN